MLFFFHNPCTFPFLPSVYHYSTVLPTYVGVQKQYQYTVLGYSYVAPAVGMLEST